MFNALSNQGNANQNCIEILPHPNLNGHYQENNKKATFIHYWWEYKLFQSLFISMEVPQKVKNRITLLSCYTTPAHISEGK
jgi:hypothetical protein